jgi:hypothetical protein
MIVDLARSPGIERMIVAFHGKPRAISTTLCIHCELIDSRQYAGCRIRRTTDCILHTGD